jgi:hypothetical protein
VSLGRELVEEVESFENSGLPVMRPNSMNNYGLILDEIGFTPMLDQLRSQYVSPFASILYPHVGGASLDYHHGFIVPAACPPPRISTSHRLYRNSLLRFWSPKVQYKLSEDKKLDFHYDESEVTLNVCLGKEFQGEAPLPLLAWNPHIFRSHFADAAPASCNRRFPLFPRPAPRSDHPRRELQVRAHAGQGTPAPGQAPTRRRVHHRRREVSERVVGHSMWRIVAHGLPTTCAGTISSSGA